MKIQWSAFFSVLVLTTLVGCGAEQFGTSAQSEKSTVSAPTGYQQYSCSSSTLVKPKVDVLYVVDNSGSTYNISDEVKASVANTVNTISQQFDYRVIGTTLINPPDDSTPYDDYRIMTNSSDALPGEALSRVVLSSSDLTFFTNPINQVSVERGLGRTYEFMNHHKGTGLLRKGAYHLIVLVSNGRDDEAEDTQENGSTKSTTFYTTDYSHFKTLQNASNLNSQQFRLFSVTAKTQCAGAKTSLNSYVKMANDLYGYSGATDNNSYRDSYDICGSGLSNVFMAVNNSIQQVVVPHVYKYWPITFAKPTDTENSFGQINVYKVSNNSAPTLVPVSDWSYYRNDAGVNTRILPTVGEFQPGPHFIQFDSGKYITYPDCVQVTSVSRTEYFGYVVIPRKPIESSIYVTINGSVIPKSTSNGWSYKGNVTSAINIKMPYPNAGDDQPAVMKSGFMIQLNGSGNYYKSGDNVQVNYTPDSI